MPQPRRLGSDREDEAAQYLLTLGWTLLGRRLKLTHGEIDVAAMSGSVLVIVEVKARRRGSALDAFTPVKAQRLRKGALEFIEKFGMPTDTPIRFDLILFDGASMTHHEDVIRSD